MLVWALTACGEETPEGHELDQEEADALFDLLADPSGEDVGWVFESWQLAPQTDGTCRNSASHTGWVRTFLNDTLAEWKLDGEAPVGSIAAKGQYADADCNGLERITAMQKRDDGWFYARYDERGTADYGGTPDLCTDCHDVAPYDHLFLTLPD
jgi:hypothetical protein